MNITNNIDKNITNNIDKTIKTKYVRTKCPLMFTFLKTQDISIYTFSPYDENIKFVEVSKKCERRILTLLKHFIDFPLILSGFEYSYTLSEFFSNAP